jgi:hypothetical protein
MLVDLDQNVQIPRISSSTIAPFSHDGIAGIHCWRNKTHRRDNLKAAQEW